MKENEYLKDKLLGSDKGGKLPKNRKEQFKYLLKDNYGFLVVLSMITFAFIIPMIFTQFTLSYKLSTIDLNDVNKNSILLSIHFFYSLLMIPCFIILGIGLSGLIYITRKMVWGEMYHLSEFFKGIKINFKRFIFIFLIYGISYFIMIMDLSYYNNLSTLPNIINFVFCFIGILQNVILFMMILFMMTQEVRYNLRLKSLIKNSFIFTIKLLFKNLLITLVILLPFLIILIVPGIYQLIILSIMFFVYFGFNSLLFTEYSASLYDKYVNENRYKDLYRKGLEK